MRRQRHTQTAMLIRLWTALRFIRLLRIPYCNRTERTRPIDLNRDFNVVRHRLICAGARVAAMQDVSTETVANRPRMTELRYDLIVHVGC